MFIFHFAFRSSFTNILLFFLIGSCNTVPELFFFFFIFKNLLQGPATAVSAGLFPVIPLLFTSISVITITACTTAI
uniref:Putative product n=1 Tax=Xenopsylla cheopis TaxID=163159 RepID=A0A6M2DVH3_XENCH